MKNIAVIGYGVLEKEWPDAHTNLQDDMNLVGFLRYHSGLAHTERRTKKSMISMRQRRSKKIENESCKYSGKG